MTHDKNLSTLRIFSSPPLTASVKFHPFAKKSAALISPHPAPAKSTGRTASLQTRPTVRRESTAPQAPSLSPPIGSCCLLFPEVPQTMPGQQLPRVPLSVCVSIYTGRGLDMPKNPQMSVIWDWFHCAAVRSRRNGTSPRTVTHGHQDVTFLQFAALLEGAPSVWVGSPGHLLTGDTHKKSE